MLQSADAGLAEFLNLRKTEIDSDSSLEEGWLSVVGVWLVAPLFDRFRGGLGKNRISRNQLQRIYLALLIDNRLQYHRALQFLPARLLGIGRMYAVDHLVICEVLRHLKNIARCRMFCSGSRKFCRSSRGRGRRRRGRCRVIRNILFRILRGGLRGLLCGRS